MPGNGVIVSRPSKWGNPFKITPEVTREKAVEMFEDYLQEMPRYERDKFLAPLRGKHLGCWCRPGSACHADILLKWANLPLDPASF